MILSASRRTDIPACFSHWFLERLYAGEVFTRNPVNGRLTRVPLSPQWVDAIVFWTKDPAPMLPLLEHIDALGYRYLFQFTLTPYGREWEPGLRDKEDIEETFRMLSRRIGSQRVLWRYDPILLGESVDLAFHKARFARLCQALSGYTHRVTLSFVDDYPFLWKKRFRSPDEEERKALMFYMGQLAPQYGIEPVTCCEKDYTNYGVGKGSCIDKKQLEALCGAPLTLKPDAGQRKGCGCVQSVDIGAYRTCKNGCVYCYANHGKPPVIAGKGPLLAGEISPVEPVKDYAALSHISDQLYF